MIALRRSRARSIAGFLVALAAAAVLAVGSRIAGDGGDGPIGADEPGLDASVAAGEVSSLDPTAELAAVRADLVFWSDRLAANARDLVAAVRLAEAHTAEARLTGDVTGYARAESAASTALATAPSYEPARLARATALAALHRFDEARDEARIVLASSPTDPTALGVLGDASQELGELAAARDAFERLSMLGAGSAADVRIAGLALLEGRTDDALRAGRSAVRAALDEGLEGEALAFHHAALGHLLVETGDDGGARTAFADALAVRPGLPAALVGVARLDAWAGDLDGAIAGYGAALSFAPLPELLARRADLYDLRAAPGDAGRAASDRATIEAVATLAETASVFDRSVAAYLADSGTDPERAVLLSTAAIAERADVHGWDLHAWALLGAGRVGEADAAMRRARATGTRDATILFHAGMIALAAERPAEARSLLEEALALGPALDPRSAAIAAAAVSAIP